jgi:hypothetical protein
VHVSLVGVGLATLWQVCGETRAHSLRAHMSFASACNSTGAERERGATCQRKRRHPIHDCDKSTSPRETTEVLVSCFHPQEAKRVQHLDQAHKEHATAWFCVVCVGNCGLSCAHTDEFEAIDQMTIKCMSKSYASGCSTAPTSGGFVQHRTKVDVSTTRGACDFTRCTPFATY